MDRGPSDHHLPDEMEHHLEALKEERLALGDTEEEAGRFARMKLGNRTAIEESVYETSSVHSLRVAARYARLALRTVLRNKAAYLPASAILALGIGMAVAMFSLTDAVLLRPLPFPGQSSIHVIRKLDPLAGSHVEELAYPELRDLQENIQDFEYVAVMPASLYGYARVLQSGNSDPVQIEASLVSHDFFRVLGVSPILGRDFSSADERVGAAPVVILSDRVWRSHFSADRGIAGRLVRLNGQGHTVIGVMAPGVEFPRGVGLWVPLGVEQRIVERRDATFLQAIVRAKPGIAHQRISSEVNALFHRLAVDSPKYYSASQIGMVTPLVDYWTGSARVHLWIMLSASLLLLAASIISAGNLVLSRTLSRQPEIAIRRALGATRFQVLTQLGTEASLIAMLAVVAGLGLAQSIVHFLIRMAPADIPRLQDATLNLNTFYFAVGVAALAAVACAIIPGWPATRMNMESTLREGGHRASLSRSGSRTRNLFVLGQASITLTLLVLAVVLVLTYRSMMSVDIGFENRDALTVNLQLRGPGVFPGQGITVEARRRFYSLLLKRLRESPGVDSAAAILLRPLEGTIGWDVTYEFAFETAGKDRKVLPKTNYEVVTPGYFQTVGTALLAGRDFDEHDDQDGLPVVIISQTLAKQIQEAGFAPLGYRLRHGLNFDKWSKVVGIAADARYRGLTQRGAGIFVPFTQATQPTNYVVLRGRQAAPDLAATVRRVLAEIDASQAMSGVATMGELIDSNAARHRFNMTLLLWFGVCAAILAATGVYSVTTEAMVARGSEIAIRNALGAPRHRLMREMISRILVYVVLGEAIGAGTVFVFAPFGAELVYQVSPRDPLVLGSVSIFLFLVSLGAAVWPASRAAGGDPKVALRVG